jgi:multimeric flavodoxin WrbA
MTKPEVTKEGQEILDRILNIRPPIIREELKAKYLSILSLLMTKQGSKEAGRDLVSEAIKMVESKAILPIFHGWEEPAMIKEFQERYSDIEAYYAGPCKVKRWERPPINKPAKRPEEMKVIALCSSPRNGGNTDVLIDEVLRGVKDAGAQGEKFMLQKLNIKTCISCRKCMDPAYERICAIKDDVSEIIFPKLIDSDAIIIGFPIYIGRESSRLTMLMERWGALGEFLREKMILKSGRRGMVIGTWGYPQTDTYDHIIAEITMRLYVSGVETVEAISACGFVGMLRGLDDKRKGLILRFPREMEKAYQAGKALVTGEN